MIAEGSFLNYVSVAVPWLFLMEISLNFPKVFSNVTFDVFFFGELCIDLGEYDWEILLFIVVSIGTSLSNFS